LHYDRHKIMKQYRSITCL